MRQLFILLPSSQVNFQRLASQLRSQIAIFTLPNRITTDIHSKCNIQQMYNFRTSTVTSDLRTEIDRLTLIYGEAHITNWSITNALYTMHTYIHTYCEIKLIVGETAALFIAILISDRAVMNREKRVFHFFFLVARLPKLSESSLSSGLGVQKPISR